MSSTLHQKIKFPHEDKVITISAETGAAIVALKLALKEIPISSSFEVCMIYKSDINEKVLSMMRSMEFFPGMGLGKNQQGPPEFIKHGAPRLKHGIGYDGEVDYEEELDIWGQLEKEKEV